MNYFLKTMILFLIAFFSTYTNNIIIFFLLNFLYSFGNDNISFCSYCHFICIFFNPLLLFPKQLSPFFFLFSNLLSITLHLLLFSIHRLLLIDHFVYIPRL